MFGILHLRQSTQNLHLAEKLEDELEAQIRTKISQRASVPHDSVERKVLDSESALMESECYVILKSNGSSITLGRGGPTALVRQFMKRYKHVPRANCMISMDSWVDASSPTCRWKNSKQTGMNHLFSIQCLRGKIHIRRKDCAESTSGTLETTRSTRVDFGRHSIQNLNYPQGKQLCVLNDVTISKIKDDHDGMLGESSRYENFLEDVAAANLRQDWGHDSAHVHPCGLSLNPNERTNLSYGDSFELHSSGVTVTCYAVQAFDEFLKYLARPKPLIVAAMSFYKELYDAQASLIDQKLDTCLRILAGIRPNESTIRLSDTQIKALSLLSEDFNEDTTQSAQSSNDAISKTQLLDIVNHLETFVDESPRSKVMKSLEAPSNRDELHAAEAPDDGRPSSKCISMTRSDMISYIEYEADRVHTDFVEQPSSKYPLESQVVYYLHDE